MSLSLTNFRRSTMFPHKPPLTEANLPDQQGKVFIVTGATSGVGEALVSILYQHNARIYVAARSEESATNVIKKLKAEHPSSSGQLFFLSLVLDDLALVQKSAAEFLAKETRLDVLWNNAAVMIPPQGSKTKQGYELQLGVNNLGPLLFTQLLRPVLLATAKIAPKSAVRVIWVSSSVAEVAPVPAIDLLNMNYERDEGAWMKYVRSKAGNVIYAAEFARRASGTGIVSVSLNPGNLLTNLQRNMPRIQFAVYKLTMAQPPKYGAYTELFAGLSQTITDNDNGSWVSPYGKVEKARKDFLDHELGKSFWDWSEEQVRQYF